MSIRLDIWICRISVRVRSDFLWTRVNLLRTSQSEEMGCASVALIVMGEILEKTDFALGTNMTNWRSSGRYRSNRLVECDESTTAGESTEDCRTCLVSGYNVNNKCCAYAWLSYRAKNDMVVSGSQFASIFIDNRRREYQRITGIDTSFRQNRHGVWLWLYVWQGQGRDIPCAQRSSQRNSAASRTKSFQDEGKIIVAYV